MEVDTRKIKNFDPACYYDSFWRRHCDINVVYHVKVCGDCYKELCSLCSFFFFVAEVYFAPNTFNLFKVSK